MVGDQTVWVASRKRIPPDTPVELSEQGPRVYRTPKINRNGCHRKLPMASTDVRLPTQQLEGWRAPDRRFSRITRWKRVDSGSLIPAQQQAVLGASRRVFFPGLEARTLLDEGGRVSARVDVAAAERGDARRRRRESDQRSNG